MKNHKYKLLLITIKYFPWILAALYFIGSILMYLDIYTSILSWVAFTGLLPIVILYMCSIAFDFCVWHRLPLYYVFLCNLLNLLSWLGCTFLFGLWFHIITLGVIALLGAYLKNKHNEQIRFTKNLSS